MVIHTDRISVFCVDDNACVLEALKLQLGRVSDMQWAGSAEHANGLLASVVHDCPQVVLLDLDMPGMDAFDAMVELNDLCPDARVLVYSGLLHRELVDRAIESGAWGYVVKTDSQHDLFEAIRAVASGAMGFSASIKSLLNAR
jgi:DNA-binding NarL/FixJ family response regulator